VEEDLEDIKKQSNKTAPKSRINYFFLIGTFLTIFLETMFQTVKERSEIKTYTLKIEEIEEMIFKKFGKTSEQIRKISHWQFKGIPTTAVQSMYPMLNNLFTFETEKIESDLYFHFFLKKLFFR